MKPLQGKLKPIRFGQLEIGDIFSTGRSKGAGIRSNETDEIIFKKKTKSTGQAIDSTSSFRRWVKSNVEKQFGVNATVFKNENYKDLRQKIREIIKEEMITEFQQRVGATNIIISGIPKGDAQRIFMNLSKEIGGMSPTPKQIRFDF